MNNKSKVLVTGSKGIIGTVLSKALVDAFEVIRLDRQGTTDTEFSIDVSDGNALDEVFSKIAPLAYVIHLAANAYYKASWDEILRDNIIATKNIYESARRYRVKRVIFASTTHLHGAYEGYPQTHAPFDRPIALNDPPRPDGDYGASKGFGELLARQYYDLYGVESICIRIGGVSPEDKAIKPYDYLWLSHRDTIQIFEKALLTPIPFGIYYAMSNNPKPVFDMSATIRDLGFAPQDTCSGE